ncbi:MAG: autotransporter domain-containing protein [Sutterella wadsworthensis]
MNRVFKTKWSVAHQEYVVTDEKHTTKTKAAKSAVALAVAALMLGAGAASAAYMAPKGGSQDPGFVANNSTQVDAAKESWETAEYNKNWGLKAMKASSAYALGYYGQGVKVGMMDSGFLTTHQELSGDRWHTVKFEGTYSQSGERYPQYAFKDEYGRPQNNGDTGKYNKGDKFSVDGAYNPDFNDNHGTGCAGVYAGNRDGVGMHGVAWGSEFYSANTGGTDSTNYGPFLDYNFFKAGYDALVNSGVKIINNSFGTNLKQVDENGKIVTYYQSGPELTTVKDIEYEYFLFKKQYNNNDADPELKGKSFVDAAWDAVKGKDVIQVFTNGNNDRANPYHRALYPYFNPEAEAQWIAIAGLRQMDKNTDPDNYKLEANFNEAGYAKYWTLTGPGQNGNTANIKGDDQYGGYSGTSMAAPFISGAFGVLASRYQDMSAVQVREVLLTTANHKNADGTDMEGWANVNKTTPAEGEVSDRMGWGVPDLEKGMYGLGQTLGKFDYNLRSELDVWSNDISQVALDQRYREDIAWLKSVTEDGTIDGKVVVSDNPSDYKLTNDYDLAGIADKNISLEDAKKWRLEYYEKRAAAIRDKINNGLYNGSIVKRGEGTLVMTGSNTYRGGTTVEGGKLLGYSNSFGVSGDDGKANGKVVVNGGTFGILETYNDQFTMKGEIERGEGTHSVDVVVNEGGTFQITAGQDVTMGKLEFKEGAGFTVGSEDVDVLKEAYAGKAQTGTVTTTGVTGADLAVANPDYAFFKTELKAEGNKLTGTLSRDETKSFATYAQNANGQAIAGALEGAAGGALYDALIGASKGDVAKTYNSLGDDFILNTRNAGIVNGMTLSRAIKDQATGIGEGRKVEMADGTARLWATGVGSWSALDYGQSDMDSDFYAGLFGAEVDVCSATKLGLFFGAGSTDNKAGDNKVESDDIHFGAYGVTNFSDVVNATYGFVYSHQSADATRALQVGSQLGMNAFSGDTDITQIFAEAAYTGLNTDAYSIEPYFGLSWIHAESDGFNEQVGTMAFSTTTEDQDVQVTTLGVRGAIPFTMGETKVALKGDVAWNHFFGDTEAEASMALAGSGVAHLKGGELGDMASVGLGVEAQVGKMTTMGLSYTGAYDGDITSHGISANVRFNF